MSGILNCLDGLARNEGIILFMTTNDRKVLKDSAFTRSCRIDIEIEFKEANEDQIYDMISYYFPEQAKAYAREDLVAPYVDYGTGTTTALLQTFFFLNRNCKDIRKLKKEYKQFMDGAELDDALSSTNKQNAMYM